VVVVVVVVVVVQQLPLAVAVVMQPQIWFVILTRTTLNIVASHSAHSLG